MLFCDHVAVWLNLSHLIRSMFVFRLQLPLVTTAGLHCYQECAGSPEVHTVFRRVLNLSASSFHPLIQGVKRDGWSSIYKRFICYHLYLRVPLPPGLKEGRAVSKSCVSHASSAALSASPLHWKIKAGDTELSLILKNLSS